MSNPAGESHRANRRRAAPRRAPLGVESLESRLLLASHVQPPLHPAAIRDIAGTVASIKSVVTTDVLAELQNVIGAPGASPGASNPASSLPSPSLAIPSDEVSDLATIAKESLLAAVSAIPSLVNTDVASVSTPAMPANPAVVSPQPPPNWTIGDVEVNGSVVGRASPATPTQLPPSSDPIQALPDAAELTLAGQLSPGNLAEVYRYAIRGAEAAIRLDVSMPEGADPTTLERLWLLDTSGDVIFHAPMPAPGGDLSVRIDAPRNGTQASVVLIGISRDGSNPSVPADYSIRIGRSDVSSQGIATSGVSAANSVPSGSTRTPWAASPRQENPTPTREGDSGTSAELTTSDDQNAGLVADGTTSLPLRSAGPSAGVLADGHSIPPVGKGDGAVIDLTLIDLAAPNDPLDEGGDPDVLTPIRSAGGIPLLGTARPSPHAEGSSDSSIALVAIDTSAEMSGSARAESPSAEGTMPIRRRPPITLGLGVAAAVAFGLLLPDFIARLTPEFPKRPLPWSRRKGRRGRDL
jgi:hypothetical protein